MTLLWAVVLTLIALPAFALTKAPLLSHAGTWQPILAAGINVVGVMCLVKGVTWAIPYLRERVPWAVPILAGAAGPAVASIQGYLAAWLGVPIDLGAVSVALTIGLGGAAVAVQQVYQQQARVAKTGGGHDRMRLVSVKQL